MQQAAVAPVQFDEVVGLHDRVVELEERHRLLAFEPELHAFHGQHAIDREVAAVVAQEGNVFELVEPLGVVDHDGVGRPVAEFEQVPHARQDAQLVFFDLLGGQQLPGFVLAGWIADLGRAAAHQQDRPVAGLLQAAQRHQLHQAADVQARRRAVEADIGRHALLAEQRIQGLGVRAVVILPPRHESAQEFGLESGRRRGHCRKLGLEKVGCFSTNGRNS